MTVVPVNVEALKKQEKLDSQAAWKTEEGWIYPGMKTTLEDNVHPKKPHPAAVDELNEVNIYMFLCPHNQIRYTVLVVCTCVFITYVYVCL